MATKSCRNSGLLKQLIIVNEHLIAKQMLSGNMLDRKCEIYSHRKNISSNQLCSDFLSNVVFTKKFESMSISVIRSVKIRTFQKKKIRQMNFLDNKSRIFTKYLKSKMNILFLSLIKGDRFLVNLRKYYQF